MRNHIFPMISGLFLGSYAISASASMFPEQWKNSNEGIWQLEVDAGYYSQSNNLLRLDVADTGPQPLPSDFPIASDDPDDDWGYGFSLAYIFPSHKHDLRFSLQNIGEDYAVTYPSFSFDPVDADGIATGSLVQEYNFSYTAAELTLGNYFDLTKTLATRLGYGLIYANIQQNTFSDARIVFLATGSPPPPVLAQQATIDFANHFHGAGLKLSADTKWDLSRYFAIVNTLGAGALYGQTETKLRGTSCSLEGPDAEGCMQTSDQINADNNSTLELDAKLGFRFSHLLTRRFNANLEAGYEAITYITALQEVDSTDEGGTVKINGDYANYGPYISVLIEFM